MANEKRIKVVHNVTTGVTEEIEMTDEEIAEIEAFALASKEAEAKRKAEAEALAEAKTSALAKLAKLGLTEDEAKAIAG